jgi:hypothetical protein
MSHNLLLSLFLLMLNLSSTWLVGSHPSWFLCPFATSPSFSEHWLAFCHEIFHIPLQQSMNLWFAAIHTTPYCSPTNPEGKCQWLLSSSTALPYRRERKRESFHGSPKNEKIKDRKGPLTFPILGTTLPISTLYLVSVDTII